MRFKKLIKNIKGGFKEINKKNDNIYLHLAARESDIAMLNSLLKNVEKIDKKDENGQTALHVAAEAGQTAAVKLLIEKGANINAKDKYDQTPLHLATTVGHTETVSYSLIMMQKQIKRIKKALHPLDVAIKGGQVEAATVLLEHGAKVNQCCDSVLMPSMVQQNNKINVLLRQYGKKEIFAFIEDYLKHLCSFLEIKMTNQDIQLFDKKTGKALSEDAIMNKLDKITQEKLKTVYKLFDDLHIN